MAVRPTLAKVALAAGVSKSTAGNVLSGRRQMSEETARRVYEAAKQLGYRADTKASGLSRGSAPILGVLYSGYMPDLVTRRSSLYWPRFNEGIVQRCSLEGTVAAFAGEQQAQALINGGVNALLVLGQDLKHFDELHIPFGMPIIATDPVPGRTVAFGMHDPYDIAASVIGHFIDSGRARIGWLRGDGAANMFDPWGLALTETAATLGAQFTVATHDLSAEQIGNGIDALVAEGVDAIFATFANSAKVAHAFKVRGLRTPEDIALVVQAEGVIEEAMTPSLSTLSLMSFESGATVAGYCLAEINETPAPSDPPPFELVVRESSRCSAGIIPLHRKHTETLVTAGSTAP
ncbi:MAG: LacI family DNA-binding transcriptional regulator [Candidatus Nanopelagicales bacterium]